MLQTSTSTIAFTEMDVEFHNCQGVLSLFLRYLIEIDKGGLGGKHKRVKGFEAFQKRILWEKMTGNAFWGGEGGMKLSQHNHKERLIIVEIGDSS